MAVILFHAQLGCPGGFVGVDIFFVISGYLITRIVQKDIDAKRFSLFRFYQRRIRRIFPALFAVILVFGLLGLRFLPPNELKDLGKTIVAASAFGSNILFFRRSGYFDTSSLQQPLLHTWTLSVEEQFYIFWPWILVFLNWRVLARIKPWAVGLVMACSLALSAYWVIYRTEAAFYLLPSRAWELAMGAILSIAPVPALLARVPRRIAEVASFAGLAMILASVFLLNGRTPFPGVAALLPCAGAALVIAAGEGRPTFTGRLLALPPLVWVGLISYSLYLWHWPILVFARLFGYGTLSTAASLLCVALIFLVSWISWRFVESPFRNPRVMGGSSTVWVMGGLATTALFLLAGLALVRGNGFPQRGPEVARWVAAQTQQADTLLIHSPCFSWSAALPPRAGCLLGSANPSAEEEAALWGDSNAAHLAPALSEIAPRMGIATRQLTKAGCPPVMGIHFLPTTRMTIDCHIFNDRALQEILRTSSVRVVIIGARWQGLVDNPTAAPANNRALDLPSSRALFIAALRRTILTLTQSGRKVILVGQVPAPELNPITCLARAHFSHWSDARCETMPEAAHAGEEARIEAALQAATQGIPNVQIIQPFNTLCSDGKCRLADGGVPLYWDVTHLSAAGSLLLEPELTSSLQQALQAPQATVPATR